MTLVLQQLGGPVHRSTLKIWLVSLLLSACAGKTPQPAAPSVPVPPREPLAWLPEDASVIGRVTLAPFQSTPLWGLWQEAQKDPEAQASLVDASKIERVSFAGSDNGGDTASFVAAVSGSFAAGELDAQAKARNIAPEPHGLLTFYRSGKAAFAQVYPELVLVCSFDRVEALAARAGQGEAVKIGATPLFSSLADRLKWNDVDLVLIAEDPRGEVKARAERQAGRYGFAFSAQDIVRAGAALKLGPSASLMLDVETTGEAQAQALKAAVEGALAGLEGNLFVGLLGIRPLIKALGANQDGKYVAVGGTLAAEDLNRVLDRVAAMLGASLNKPEPATP
jgi:hypothetical protein